VRIENEEFGIEKLAFQLFILNSQFSRPGSREVPLEIRSSGGSSPAIRLYYTIEPNRIGTVIS
jgi:hypothetical protein